MATNINHPAYTPHPGSQDKGETKREKWAAQFMAEMLKIHSKNMSITYHEMAHQAIRAANALETVLNEQ